MDKFLLLGVMGMLTIFAGFEQTAMGNESLELQQKNFDINYDPITQSGTITTTHERISQEGEWHDYLYFEESEKFYFFSNEIGSLIYDKNTCSYSVYDNGFTGTPILTSVSWMPRMAVDQTDSWNNLTELYNAECMLHTVQQNDGSLHLVSLKEIRQDVTTDVTWIEEVFTQDETIVIDGVTYDVFDGDRWVEEQVDVFGNGTLVTQRFLSPDGRFIAWSEPVTKDRPLLKLEQVIKFDLDTGIKETIKIHNDNPSFDNHKFGAIQTIHLVDDLQIDGQTISLEDSVGLTFDRQFILDNSATILGIADSMNYDLDKGIDYIASISVDTDNRVALDYSWASGITPVGGHMVIDPTLTMQGNIVGGNITFDFSGVDPSYNVQSGTYNGALSSSDISAIQTAINTGGTWTTSVATGSKTIKEVFDSPVTQTWTVPSGVSSIEIKAWGAGGGGRLEGTSTSAGGGGYTGLFSGSSASHGNARIIAGGGGGGAGGDIINGGSGGGVEGQHGLDCPWGSAWGGNHAKGCSDGGTHNNWYYGGQGGTQSAGGSGAGYGSGSSGSALSGANGGGSWSYASANNGAIGGAGGWAKGTLSVSSGQTYYMVIGGGGDSMGSGNAIGGGGSGGSSKGGGGGGGYYGGASGGSRCCGGMGGGGGGSGYLHSSLTNDEWLIGGSGKQQGVDQTNNDDNRGGVKTDDIDYVTGHSHNMRGGDGGDGLMVITYTGSGNLDELELTYTVPSPASEPQSLSASAGQPIQLTWTQPSSDGGKSIIDYEIERGDVSHAEQPLPPNDSDDGHVDMTGTNLLYRFDNLDTVTGVIDENITWDGLVNAQDNGSGNLATTGGASWNNWAKSDRTWAVSDGFTLTFNEAVTASGNYQDSSGFGITSGGFNNSPNQPDSMVWDDIYTAKPNDTYTFFTEEGGSSDQRRVICPSVIHNHDGNLFSYGATPEQKIEVETDGTVNFYWGGSLLQSCSGASGDMSVFHFSYEADSGGHAEMNGVGSSQVISDESGNNNDSDNIVFTPKFTTGTIQNKMTNPQFTISGSDLPDGTDEFSIGAWTHAGRDYLTQHNGAVVNELTYKEGKVENYALDFNGVNTWVDSATKSVYNPLLDSGGGTLAFWIKFDSLSDTDVVFDNNDRGSSNQYTNANGHGISSWIDSNSKLNVNFYNGGSATTINTSSGLSTDTWYHFVIQNTGSGDVKMWLDGSPVTFSNGLTTMSYSAHSNSPALNMRLGHVNTGTQDADLLDGQIDQWLLYDGTLLSQNEINQIYNSGDGTDDVPLTNLIIRYDFEHEGSETVVNGSFDPTTASVLSYENASGDMISFELEETKARIINHQAGMVTSDSVGSKANFYGGGGTFSGGQTGLIGDAYYADGGYKFINNDSNLWGLEGGTVGGDWLVNGWIYNTGSHSNNGRVIAEQQGLSGHKLHWYYAGNSMQMCMGQSSDQGSSATKCSSALNTNTWEMLSLKRDGSTMRWYVNGVEFGTWTIPTGSTYSTFSGGDWCYNTYRCGSGYNGNNYYDEWSYWARTVSDAEILELYNSGQGKEADQMSDLNGLQVYHDFENGNNNAPAQIAGFVPTNVFEVTGLTMSAVDESHVMWTRDNAGFEFFLDGVSEGSLVSTYDLGQATNGDWYVGQLPDGTQPNSSLDELFVMTTDEGSQASDIYDRGNDRFTNIGSSTTTSFDDNNTVAGNTYYYRVSADNGLLGTWATPVSGISGQPPDPPSITGISINDPNPSPLDITLTWQNGLSMGTGNFQNYIVIRSPDSTFSTVTTVGTPTAQTYTDTVPSAGDWHYKVATQTTHGASTNSSPANIQTPVEPNPPASVNVTLQDADSNPFDTTVTWTVPSSDGGSAINGYKVYRDSTLLATLGNVLTYSDTVPSTSGTSYLYEVSATNPTGESLTKTSFTHTSPTVPSAVSDLAGQADTDTEASFTWTEPSTGGSAIIRYDIVQDGSIVDNTSNLTYTRTGLTQGTSYAFNVIAVNNIGSSTNSNTVNITTHTPVTGTISGNAITDGATVELTVTPNITGGSPTPSFQTYTIKEGSTVIQTFTGTTYYLQLQDGLAHTYTVESTDSNHWNNPTLTGTFAVQADYDPDWKDSLAYNYTRSGGTWQSYVNRADTNNWDIHCIYRTTDQVIAGEAGITSTSTGIWAFNETQSIPSTKTVYWECKESANSNNVYFTATSFATDRLGGGILLLDNIFADWTGTPVALFFILLVAGLFTGRSAPTGILLILAVVGIMGFIGMLTIDEATFGFVLLAGILGIFVGKRFL